MCIHIDTHLSGYFNVPFRLRHSRVVSFIGSSLADHFIHFIHFNKVIIYVFRLYSFRNGVREVP